jgi:TolA-binding protein
MKKITTMLLGLVLAATFCGTALAKHDKGGGAPYAGSGGGGENQAGGLPALEDRVDALESLVDTLQGQVTTLEGEVATLQSQVSTLQTQVGTLQTDVTDLQGQNNWAVVSAAGSVVRNSGPSGSVAVSHTSGTGLYEVLFSKNVSGCSYVATLGDTGTATPPLGFVAVSGDSSNPAGVTVQTSDSSADASDEPFHVYVSCP